MLMTMQANLPHASRLLCAVKPEDMHTTMVFGYLYLPLLRQNPRYFVKNSYLCIKKGKILFISNLELSCLNLKS